MGLVLQLWRCLPLLSLLWLSLLFLLRFFLFDWLGREPGGEPIGTRLSLHLIIAPLVVKRALSCVIRCLLPALCRIARSCRLRWRVQRLWPIVTIGIKATISVVLAGLKRESSHYLSFHDFHFSVLNIIINECSVRPHCKFSK